MLTLVLEMPHFIVVHYLQMYPIIFIPQVYAWGDNDHGQQANGTTTVNHKPALVHGLDGIRITRVACGSSHSVAWSTTNMATPATHEPVLFSVSRDQLGANSVGKLDVDRTMLFICITI